MNPNESNDDLVERAITAMLKTAGTDSPPATVVNRVRQTIAERQSAGSANRPMSGNRYEGVSWLALAMTLLLMVTCGSLVGFHRRLLSEVAGQPSETNGARYVFYTDGRVEMARQKSQ